MLTNEQIRSQVEAAFSPYRCVAEICDYDRKLSFRVFNSSDLPLVTVKELVLASVRDASALELFLTSVSLRIEQDMLRKG